MKLHLRLAAVVAALLWAATARAQETSTVAAELAANTDTATTAKDTAAKVDAELPEGPVVAPEDARGWVEKPGIEQADVLLFLPRAILFVPKIALRLLYFPFEGALWLINEYSLDERLIDLLYNDERTAAVLPLFLYIPGQGPRAGLTLFHKDLFGNDEEGRIAAKFGGVDGQSYDVSFQADRLRDTHLWLEAQARYEVEGRRPFVGIGTLDSNAVETRFKETRFLGRVRAGTTYGAPDERFKLGASLIYNRRRFGEGTHLRAGERSIESAYDVNELVGFNDGVDLFEVTGDLILDFRDRQGFTSNGIYLEAFGGGAPEQKGYRFVHYGAEASVFIDLYKRTRVLAVRAAIEGVEGDNGRIPFSELPRLGGADRLRGYKEDTYRDEKMLLGSIEYHYPIHHNLAGQIFFDIGTVAKNYPELFKGGTRDWKIGYGAGLLLGSEDSLSFRLDVSYGEALMLFLSTDVPHAFTDRTEEL